MKKIIKSLMIFVLLICCFPLYACEKKEDKFWEQTNTMFNKFIEDVCENSNYKNGIVYGTTISTILSKSDVETNYKEYYYLTSVYDPIFVMSFSYLETLKGVFINIPNVADNNTKKAYLKLETEIADCKKALEDFATTVSKLDGDILGTNVSNANSAISLQGVKEFKRAYISLSKNFISLSQNVLNLCTTYIYPSYDSFIDKDGNYIDLSETQIENQKTIANLKNVICTINPAIEYINSFNGEYLTLGNDNFFTILESYTNIDNAVYNSATIEELSNWNDIFKAYLVDLDNFYDSLSHFNMQTFLKSYNLVIDDYAKEDSKLYGYYAQITNFSSKKVVLLQGTTNSMCTK